MTNESDLVYTIRVLEGVAKSGLGKVMRQPAREYRQLLECAKLCFDAEEEPTVFLSTADAWTNCAIRYVIPARTRRRWATRLLLAVSEELAKPEHRGKCGHSPHRQESGGAGMMRPPIREPKFRFVIATRQV